MNQKRNAIIFWCVVLAIGAVVGGFFGIRSMIRGKQMAPFQAHVQEYLAMAGPAAPTSEGYVKGKVITVDTKDKSIDYLYFDLPEELQAKTPDEVGTVVLLQWGEEQVGHYDSPTGPGAYKHTCQVILVDKERKAVVGGRRFVGSDPPQRKKSSESGYGSKPTSEIVTFLRTVPRK